MQTNRNLFCSPLPFFFLHCFRAPSSDSPLPLSLSLFLPSLLLLTPAVSPNLCFLSIHFYPPPYARLALAAPYFLNLSRPILFGSLLGSSNTRSKVLLSSLLLILHESSSQFELFFSPFFPYPLSGPLYPGPCRSPSLSFYPLHTVSLTSTAVLYGSLLRTAFPRYDPAEPRRWRHGKKAALKELHIFYALTATWVVQNGRQWCNIVLSPRESLSFSPYPSLRRGSVYRVKSIASLSPGGPDWTESPRSPLSSSLSYTAKPP